jgi:small subunit ribosomal protein S2
VTQVGIKELLEAGVHFGHQTRRWNPKMRRFIFGERGGIHIIDLQKTERLLDQAQTFAADIASRGGTILFVGTKKQARDAVREAADRAGMPYVNQRWLGGLLTNFQTISRRIKRLHELTDWTESGTLELLPTRERIAAIAERDKLEMNLGGVRNMERPPAAVFIVDLKTEAIAVREAERLKIPIIGLVDTNCDPDPVTYVIPGNDDAIRSCKLIVDAIGDVAAERAARFRQEEEERRRREEEERQRREAEEQARRDAEEQARREAEEAAARAAAEQQQAAEAGAAAPPATSEAPAPEAPPAAPEAPPAAPEAPPAPPEPEPAPEAAEATPTEPAAAAEPAAATDETATAEEERA